MPGQHLSKSRIMAGLQCAKRLWLEVHRPDLIEYDPGVEQRLAVGEDVNDVARSQYPGGVLVEYDEGADAAIADTMRLLEERPGTPIFEATFSADGVLVRADIFKPHAVMLTEERFTSSITMYAITGGARYRMFFFEDGSKPETYLAQARECIPEIVPFFGPPIGYVINYTPDYAEEFNKEGRLIRKLDRARRVGQSGLIIGGKYIGESTWTALLGAVDFRPGHEVD